jgi:hypothetical protein
LDYFDSHIEVEYLNKPFFVQLKRVWRKVKSFADPDKPKKLGFFLQSVRGLEGSAQVNEKIVKDIFGNSQQMTPNDFIKKVFSFEVPQGKKTYVKHETAYQQTQRLVTSRDSDTGATRDREITHQAHGSQAPRKFGVSGGKKLPPEPLNKTIQVSIFGDVYEDILKKYKDHPQGDNIIRAINRNLDGHFTNAAAFVRWTQMTPSWIHIDAFQTDFFNKVKAMKFTADKKGDELSAQVSDDFRKYEDEFFKAALSYITRSHPGVKMYTANTEDLVKAVERVRGDVKLKEYYYKLPKMLGFRMVNLSDIEKKFHLGPEKAALEKHFKPALSGMSTKVSDTDINNAVDTFKENLIVLKREKENKEITKELIDELMANTDMPDQVSSALHQILDELTDVVNGKVKKPNASGKEIKVSIMSYLNSKKAHIKEIISKASGPGTKIWWADKRMLFENTIRHNNRIILEDIRRMAGL